MLAGASGGGPGRGGRPRGRPGRQAPGRLRGRRPTATATGWLAAAAGARGGAAAGVHGAVGGGGAGRAAADRERQAGPQGAARPGLRGGRRRGPGPGDGARGDAVRGVRRGAGRGRGRRRRRLLRPRRALAAGGAAGGAAAACAGVSVSVRALFEAPTPAGLAAAAGRGGGRGAGEPDPGRRADDHPGDAAAGRADRRRRSSGSSPRSPGGAANVADVYPLAPLQEGMLFHHLLADGGADVVRDADGAASSTPGSGWTAFVGGAAAGDRPARHLPHVGGVGGAARAGAGGVAAARRCRSTEVDPDRDGADAAASSCWPRSGSSMDSGPGAAAATCTWPPSPTAAGWLALLRIHHLVQDHTALEVLLGEVAALLAGRARRAARAAAVPRLRGAGPARRGRARSTSGTSRELLGDVTSRPRRSGCWTCAATAPASVRAGVPVDAELAGRLREVARRLGVSPATVFHVAWARVLAAVSRPRRRGVRHGAVRPDERRAGADRVPGLFINTLPVRVRIGEIGVPAAVAAMRGQLAGLLEHEHAPLALAQRASGVPGDAPLFTSLFNYRHSSPARAGRSRRPARHRRRSGMVLRPGAHQLPAGRRRSTTTATASRLTRGRGRPGRPQARVRAAAHAAGEPGRRAGSSAPTAPGPAAGRSTSSARPSGAGS